MRILKVSRCYHPAAEYGGPIGKMLALSRGLIGRGHKVTVYTSNLLNPRRKMSDGTSVCEMDGARIVYLNSVLNYHWDPITPDVFGFCRRELTQFDVIHVYGYRDFISTFVSWYARRRHVPYFIEPMGMFKPMIRSLLQKRLYDWVYGDGMAQLAAGVIATSTAERREIIERGIDPGRVIIRRNGVDLDELRVSPRPGAFRRRLGLGDTDRLVLYLGRISKKKGIGLLIRSLCDARLARTHLAVVGPDDCDGHVHRLENLVDTSALTARVAFTGPLYGQEKVEALHDSDVLVLPSANENFGNVVAEAVACGTPVIVTDRCGIAPFVLGTTDPAPPRRLHQTGCPPVVSGPGDHPEANSGRNIYTVGRVGLVIPFNETALREALVRTITDDGLISTFRGNAPAAASELSWDGPIRRMEDLYKSAVLGPVTADVTGAPAASGVNCYIGNCQGRTR